MWYNLNMREKPISPEPLVAYISMEIALENNIKTYAGGLGVLAGDILCAAADLKFPMAGVTLFNRSGYFKQIIDKDGEQAASPENQPKRRVISPEASSHPKKITNPITISPRSRKCRIMTRRT